MKTKRQKKRELRDHKRKEENRRGELVMNFHSHLSSSSNHQSKQQHKKEKMKKKEEVIKEKSIDSTNSHHPLTTITSSQSPSSLKNSIGNHSSTSNEKRVKDQSSSQSRPTTATSTSSHEIVKGDEILSTLHQTGVNQLLENLYTDALASDWTLDQSFNPTIDSSTFSHPISSSSQSFFIKS